MKNEWTNVTERVAKGYLGHMEKCLCGYNGSSFIRLLYKNGDLENIEYDNPEFYPRNYLWKMYEDGVGLKCPECGREYYKKITEEYFMREDERRWCEINPKNVDVTDLIEFDNYGEIKKCICGYQGDFGHISVSQKTSYQCRKCGKLYRRKNTTRFFIQKFKKGIPNENV